MSKTARSCCECSKTIQASAKAEARFCSTACKDRWNNRRKNRGAELYDLFYVLRYDRSRAKALGVWSAMCKLAQLWRDEDREAKRTSPCRDPEDVLADNPALRTTILQR